MRFLYRLTPFLLFLILLSCKHKKQVSLSGEEPVEVSDFIGFFQPLDLPFQYSDTALARKEKDSLLISYKVFSQFVPDSVLGKLYGKGVKPKIYALGKMPVPKAETYLLVKTIHNDKRALLVLGFDKKQQFIASFAALRPDQSSATAQSLSADRRYTFTKSVLRRNPDGSFSEGKDVYILNEAARNFTLIMTDALEDRPTELINPIDTLPRKQKWSADYTNGKMNLVSVRDGRKPDRISFFIHFEKDEGQCTGELKGEALIRSANRAEYRVDGDPCKLILLFSANSVTLQEEEGCGSHRGMKCSFNGSYARKKYVKPAPAKNKNK